MSDKKEITTRKDEIIITTRNPMEMHGMYLAKDLKRGWKEDFIDGDSGEVVTIDRHEIVAQKGIFLDNDKISEIAFMIQSGDIEEVQISNQRREAIFITRNYMTLWFVTININQKNHKLLLHAKSAESALEIAKDYTELHYAGYFIITNIKEYGSAIMIDKSFTQDEDLEAEEKLFYKIEVKVMANESYNHHTFISYSPNADAAMILINDWLTKNKDEDTEDMTTVLESASSISCNQIVEKEFSKVYLEEE